MADATSRKLLQLLKPAPDSDLRCAAAMVLAEVGPKDAQVSLALCEALDDPDAIFRAQVLRAIGKLRVERALPRLLTVVGQGGANAEAAAQAAACLGEKGSKALRDMMADASPVLRRRIAAALGAGGTSSAETAALDALLDEDAGVVDAATRSLIAQVPSLGAEHRRALADHVLTLLKRKKGLRTASAAALVRLLAAFGDPRSDAALWARVDATNPPELRAAALQALGSLPAPSARERVQRLLDCAASPDFRVAAPALLILRGVPVGERTWHDWLPLLDAADPAARQFAMDKLHDRDNAEVAVALVRQLSQPDRSVREQALARLSKLEHGRKALSDELLAAESADEAWALARAQSPFARDQAAGLRSELFSRACRYLEAGDRRADALLFLLREGDPADLRDRIEDRALALRKKKNFATALTYLRLLTRDPACSEAVRFEAAACALKLSNHHPAADSRAADPALHQFAALLHRHETDPLVFVQKARWLDPADLFYLGFHFSEGGRQEKELGRNVLQLVVRRSPRGKLAKDARSKLRSEGLD